jgi:hypothetical protein
MVEGPRQDIDMVSFMLRDPSQGNLFMICLWVGDKTLIFNLLTYMAFLEFYISPWCDQSWILHNCQLLYLGQRQLPFFNINFETLYDGVPKQGHRTNTR